MFTPEQRLNLETLASYLEAMPQDYARTHFLMSSYLVCLPDVEGGVEDFGNLREYYDAVDEDESNDNVSDLVDQPANSQYSCGTCACAVGHGPAAGVAVSDKDRNWEAYAFRAFGVTQQLYLNGDVTGDFVRDAWQFMFGPDNADDPYAAAARIRTTLAKYA